MAHSVFGLMVLLMSCRCSSEHEPNFCSDGRLHSCASLRIHDGARSEKYRHVLNIGNYPFCVRAECVCRVSRRERSLVVVRCSKHVLGCPLHLNEAQWDIELTNCPRRM